MCPGGASRDRAYQPGDFAAHHAGRSWGGGAMTQTSPKLSCHNLWKVYGQNSAQFFAQGGPSDINDAMEAMRARAHIPAVADVSFDVAEGEIFVIMGLSGSGKSTVIRCLSRLVEPSFGAVLLDGEDLMQADDKRLIEIRRHKMGMVFQSFGLLPHLTVLQNIAFPLKIQGMALAQREARARQLIEQVSLSGREDAFPSQLSGGQQQRVGIARSLAVEPDIWFLDEPFSALDPLIRRQMQDEFLYLQASLKKTIVFITHDFLEALRLADRICIMQEGQIVQIGTPADIIMRPADTYVADFTRDVPQAKVLRAGDIAVRSIDTPPSARVAHDLPVEDLLALLAKGESAVTVMGPDGEVMGVVDMKCALATLSRGEAHGS